MIEGRGSWLLSNAECTEYLLPFNRSRARKNCWRVACFWEWEPALMREGCKPGCQFNRIFWPPKVRLGHPNTLPNLGTQYLGQDLGGYLGDLAQLWAVKKSYWIDTQSPLRSNFDTYIYVQVHILEGKRKWSQYEIVRWYRNKENIRFKTNELWNPPR